VQQKACIGTHLPVEPGVIRRPVHRDPPPDARILLRHVILHVIIHAHGVAIENLVPV
jgi:hypothetical protein